MIYHCWDCGSSDVFVKKTLVGKELTSRFEIENGAEDQNSYLTFLVCGKCGYKCQPHQDIHRKKIVYNAIRNQKIVDLAIRFIKAKQPTLIYLGEMRHVTLIHTLLEQKMKETGLDSSLLVLVHGQIDSDINDLNRKKLIAGSVLCAISTSIWGEGTDIPPLRWLIYGKAGSANNQTGGIELEQLLGRLGRRYAGKWRGGFIDFRDEFDTRYATKSRARRRFLGCRGFMTRVLAPAPMMRKDRIRFIGPKNDGKVV